MRHARCAVLTGVQTCALPIYLDPHRRSRGRFAILDPSSSAGRAAPVIQDRQEPIMQIISTSDAADNAAFFAAIANAERRALHSYFDQHVVADEEIGRAHV